jgi:predicted AlkP superfamily phosphohydrolase/phosphomutase
MAERGGRPVYERVFVLEVSGPTLELLNERIERLPNFRRFLRQGAWSRLRSPLQPVLPPAFATLLTGKNPGKTGLFDFFKFPAGGYGRIPYSTALLAQEPFYQLLSRRGMRVGMLNVPLTYPLPQVNGFVVSGDEGIEGDYAWPPEVTRALDAESYSVPFGASYAPGREVEFARRAGDVIALRRRALLRLFEDRTWQFGMLTIHAFGEVLHAFWKFYDPRHPAYTPVARQPGLGDPFMDGFEALDQLLGDIVDLVGPRGLVLVIGAWSHRLEHSRVHFNALLVNAGYLRFKRSVPAQLKWLAFRLGITAASAERLAHDLNLYRLFHYKLGRGTRSAVTSATFLSFGDIDWARTRAVAMGYLGQIYLNVRGHRPQGTIAMADYARERDTLRDLLAGIRDPRSGQPMVERVVTRDEAYSGDELTNAPDLIVHLREGYSGQSGFSAGRLVTDAPANHSSDHWDQSYLLALGDGIRAGQLESRLEDVAPTVLHALGQPVPDDYDGRVLPMFEAS